MRSTKDDLKSFRKDGPKSLGKREVGNKIVTENRFRNGALDEPESKRTELKGLDKGVVKEPLKKTPAVRKALTKPSKEAQKVVQEIVEEDSSDEDDLIMM